MNFFYCLLLFLLPGFHVFCQSKTIEFEGRIHYRHQFIINDIAIDSAALVNALGSSSIYTYKSGKFLWISHGSDFQHEVFNAETGLLYDKYESSDSVQFIDVFKKSDTIVSYKIVENADTICGYRCHSIEMEIQSQNDKTTMKRKIFYAPELLVDPEHFVKYRSYANNQIYKLTRSAALRLITEYHDFPIVVIMNAEKVEVDKIPDNVFILKGK